MACKWSPKVLLLGMAFLLAFLSMLLFPSNDAAMAYQRVNLQTGQHPPNAPFKLMKNQTIVFVHVGKTGGETIQWRVKLSCNQRRTKWKKIRCLEQFKNGQESFVSQSTVGYLHCDKLKPRGIIPNVTMFMLSIRNPIQRIVSWFQYMHPANCIPERPSGACNLKKSGSQWGVDFYQTCFPDVNDFVLSLRDPLQRGETDCSAMALATVTGNGPEGPSNHMFYNYHYYINRTVAQYPEKAVVAIRQEMLWDDLRSIEQLLGGSPLHPFETEGPVMFHGSDKFLYRAQLDPTLIPLLCCSIPREISAYVQILSRALNLEARQKSISLNYLLQQCRAASMTELKTQCRWNAI